jgi:hypothetical protein
LADETQPAEGRPGDASSADPVGSSSAGTAVPPGFIVDPLTGQTRPMTFMEKARQAAGAAAVAAAKASVDVGSQAARVGADVGAHAARAGADIGREAAHQAATTIKDPATKARAAAALRKAKRGFATALERIDPKILADVVVKATSLQERANASLKERGSVYRIGEIAIGASIPPSIQFSIVRTDDPTGHDSSTLLEKAVAESPTMAQTIVTLDGTTIDDETIEEVVNEA